MRRTIRRPDGTSVPPFGTSVVRAPPGRATRLQGARIEGSVGERDALSIGTERRFTVEAPVLARIAIVRRPLRSPAVGIRRRDVNRLARAHVAVEVADGVGDPAAIPGPGGLLEVARIVRQLTRLAARGGSDEKVIAVAGVHGEEQHASPVREPVQRADAVIVEREASDHARVAAVRVGDEHGE